MTLSFYGSGDTGRDELGELALGPFHQNIAALDLDLDLGRDDDGLFANT